MNKYSNPEDERRAYNAMKQELKLIDTRELNKNVHVCASQSIQDVLHLVCV